MHPLGCFGSSLAFAPQTSICQGCSARAECEAIVEARRPQFLKLLSRFTDASGEKVAVAWLKPAERKKLKANRKAAALAEAERETYGDTTTALAIKANLDSRVHPLLDRLTMQRINPKVSSLEVIGGFSSAMAEVVCALRNAPRVSMRDLTATLAQRCSYSATNAQREAYALVSILTVCDRAQRVGPFVELS
jgi:hypothetical protein